MVEAMNTLEADIEIAADGSLKLLSPLPAWVKPGKAHVLLTVGTDLDGKGAKPKREIPRVTPEIIERRLAAFEELRKLDPYRDIADSVAWQKENREDVEVPGRE